MVNETGNGQCELVRQGSDEVGFLIPFGGCAKEKERSAQDPEFLEQLCHCLRDRRFSCSGGPVDPHEEPKIIRTS